MQRLYSVADIRAAEDAAMSRLPDGALMHRAAGALAVQAADLLRDLGGVYGRRVALLVGTGNNGGDTLYAGARLARRGARVTALLLDPARVHADGLAAFDAAGGRTADADPAALTGAELIMDGMLGIGGRGGLRDAAADLAQVATSTDALILAVDVPSGLACDTGAADGVVVTADVTVTFGALKQGLLLADGPERAGELRLVDIGLDATLPDSRLSVLEARDVAARLPRPTAADDKYTRGVVGIVAGSAQYAGAGVLATGAALHGGAGMVRYLGGAPDEIRADYPEVVVHPDTRPQDVRVQAWVVGPGLGTDDDARGRLRDVLATDLPVIVDADAITLAAEDPDLLAARTAPTVLTPHDREFARIAPGYSDGPGADRPAAARAAAAALGVTLLLKGNATVIAAPDGEAYVNATGTPWLATAGSGDVLSGLLGSLLATGLDATEAATLAAYVHGVAGQRAATGGPPTAADVRDAVRGALLTITRG